MEIDVYETFASSKKGNAIHFDVLLPSGGKKEDASKYAKVFLEKIGEAAEALDSCKFCHSEKADVEVEKADTIRWALHSPYRWLPRQLMLH